MRRFLVPAFLILASADPQEHQEIRIHAEAFRDTVFTVYEDSSCTEHVSTGDSPVYIQMEEDGSIILPAMYEGKWLREEEAMTGFYLSKGTEIREGAEICPEPIVLSISSVFPGDAEQEEMTYVFSGNDFCMEMKASEAGAYMQAGQSYTVSEKEIPELFTSAEPQVISVPMQRPDTDPCLTFLHNPLSEVIFATPDGSEAAVALYTDADGKEPFMIDGEAAVISTGEKTVLPAGQYWYRITACSTSFYEDDMVWPLRIEPEKVRLYEEHLQLEKPSLKVRMNGNDPYRITVYCSGHVLSCWDNDGREHIVYPERNSDCTVIAEAETDYYSLQPRTVHIGSSGSGSEIVLEPEPFTVRVSLVNAFSGLPFSGEITVMDSTGNSVCRQKCGEEGTILHGLRQNEIYYLQGTGADADPSASSVIRTDGRREFDIHLSVNPFIRTDFRIESRNSRYTLYTDQECLHPASDRHDKVLEDLQGGAYLLAAGTYYLKQSFCAEDEYPDRDVHMVRVSEKGAYVSVPARPVEAILYACDKENGTVLDGVELVLKEDGKSVSGWTGEKTLQLKRNTEYTLCMRERVSSYLPGNEVVFRMPDDLPEEEQTFRILLEPYYTVTLFAESERDGMFQSFSAELFTDRNRKEPAEDIYGNPVEFMMYPEKPHVIHMKKGVYYLFQKEGTGQYEWKEPVRIEAAGRGINITVPVTPVAFGISFISEDGNPVIGAEFSLLSESGDMIESWTSMDQMHVSSGNASPGEKLVIHQVSVPPGYERMKTDLVYTVPLEAPAVMPVLEICAAQYADSDEKNASSVQSGSAEGNGFLPVCAVLLVVVSAGILRMKCKKLH